jgi:hypothetical protein
VHALVLLDGALGLGLVAAIAVAASRPPAARSSGRRLGGWILVLGPLPLAVVLHLLARLPQAVDQTAFVLGVLCFAAGARLVLTRDEDDGWREPSDRPEPFPWWPDFERELREYERRASRHPIRV